MISGPRVSGFWLARRAACRGAIYRVQSYRTVPRSESYAYYDSPNYGHRRQGGIGIQPVRLISAGTDNGSLLAMLETT